MLFHDNPVTSWSWPIKLGQKKMQIDSERVSHPDGSLDSNRRGRKNQWPHEHGAFFLKRSPTIFGKVAQVSSMLI